MSSRSLLKTEYFVKIFSCSCFINSFPNSSLFLLTSSFSVGEISLLDYLAYSYRHQFFTRKSLLSCSSGDNLPSETAISSCKNPLNKAEAGSEKLSFPITYITNSVTWEEAINSFR